MNLLLSLLLSIAIAIPVVYRKLETATVMLEVKISSTTAASSSLYMWGANIKGTIPGVERSHVDVPTEIHWRNVLSGESANELDE